MSKTTPVRWWRDDATRYVTRGPQIVPAARSEATVAWAFDLLRPDDRDIARRLEDPWGDQAMRDGRSIADPVADLHALLDAQRREVERLGRGKP